MAPQELEKSASQYATGAIKYDAQGARGMAITNYQKATETLLKLTPFIVMLKLIIRKWIVNVPVIFLIQ